ncbi:MAG: adenosylcobinamide-GDP ribazoletransferase [Candidatus Hodgkinia cicadicola]
MQLAPMNEVWLRFKTAVTNGLTRAISFAEIEFNRFKNCVALLTIIPVYNLKPTDDCLQYALAVAIITQAIASIALMFKTSAIDLIMYMALKRLLQGCIHEDALADIIDSSNKRSKCTRLAIIKDPKIGVFGALALLLLLSTEYVLLKPLNKTKLIKVTAICELIGCFNMLWHWACLPYAYSPHKLVLHTTSVVVCAIIAISALCVCFGYVRAVITVIQMIALSVWFNIWSLANLGGKTGDTLGAIKLLSETLSLVCVSA